jgi:molecular chaperone GrpE
MAKGKKHDEINEIEEELKDTKTEAKENKATKQKASEEKTNETAEAEEIIRKNEEIEALNNKLLRLQADYLNYKERTEKEKHTRYGDAVTAMICDLLPVIDNLERAIAADVSETDNFKEGVVMVYNQLMGILNRKGLKEIEALHKPFDHNLHYGVAFEECEEFDDGIIIDVLQKGYTVNDKLIRPSMVRICKK